MAIDVHNFDKNIMLIIAAFLNLKDKCYAYERDFLGHHFFNVNRNKLNFLAYSSFYSHFCDVCDIPLFFLINEEISNSHGRDCFDSLFNEMVGRGHYVGGISKTDVEVKNARKELVHLLKFRFNESVGSLMLDFTVSAFSAFECWISKLYGAVCAGHENELMQSRRDKIIKAILNYHESPSSEEMERSIKKIASIPGGFVSFHDKLAAVFKVFHKDRYGRDKAKDLEIIQFLGAKRNTVHNGGVHFGQSKVLTHKGVAHSLIQGSASRSDSWPGSLELVGELIDIYTEILKSIENRSDYLPSYIEYVLDDLAFKILSQEIKGFVRREDAIGSDNFSIILKFLVNRYKLSESRALRFLGMIQDRDSNKDFDDSELLELLGKDLGP